MPWTRNKNAWMWVAIAAVAFSSVARAETRQHTAKGYTHPVLEFLARSQGQNSAAHAGTLRFAHLGSRRQAGSIFRKVGSGAVVAVLPVLFIGLVSPLTLASVRLVGRVPSAPPLSALFQRPPPSLA